MSSPMSLKQAYELSKLVMPLDERQNFRVRIEMCKAFRKIALHYYVQGASDTVGAFATGELEIVDPRNQLSPDGFITAKVEGIEYV
jgi:hypothetical protein